MSMYPSPPVDVAGCAWVGGGPPPIPYGGGAVNTRHGTIYIYISIFIYLIFIYLFRHTYVYLSVFAYTLLKIYMYIYIHIIYTYMMVPLPRHIELHVVPLLAPATLQN